MERIREIYNHPVWKREMMELEDQERERIFCKHGLEHLLDVARIAYIENLENGYGIPKELIYAAALLHDIGRNTQYAKGISHEKAGETLAREILKESTFDAKEQKQILQAVAGHRDGEIREKNDLSGIIYRADKGARMCWFCTASDKCNWNEKKKNHVLVK